MKIIPFKDYSMTAYILQHEKTGAQYYHIDTPDLNNTLAIHFKTPAFDNTGVFHILEHLSLCGSKRYPVRDPFMNMIKRSLGSYMNAWTGNDFTMYLFSAQNTTDYNNLRGVYTDAVLNPNLTKLDFLQEGWRTELFDQNDDNSDLIFKGVVLNEMKGDSSRQDVHFIQKVYSNLFPNNAYKFNSGGEPKFIPTLTYENLLKTHENFYHPSNMKIFSYGDMNFLHNLEYFEEILSK